MNIHELKQEYPRAFNKVHASWVSTLVGGPCGSRICREYEVFGQYQFDEEGAWI